MRRGATDTAWREEFLAALSESPNVREAAARVGIGRKTAYRHRERSVEFREAWDAAIEDGCDRLEEALFNRAVHGVKKTIFYKDQPIGEETTYSDTAAIFLLKGHRPEKYRERTDVTSDGNRINVQFYLPERDPDPRDDHDPAAARTTGEVPPVDR